MKKISICVPTYNSGEKLKRTLDSLVNQTMHKSDYEIIIVDDNSNDGTTVKIIKEYKKLYNPLFRVKYLRKNSGSASAPRNKAMKIAKGEYIFFVDSDDLLTPEALQNMYNYAKKNKSDLVVGKYGVKGKGRGVPRAPFEKGNIPDADIIDNSLIYALSVLKLFKSSVIKRNKIEFTTTSSTAEDQLFTMEFIMNCGKISILSDQEYYIVINDFESSNHLSTKKSTGKEYFTTISKVFLAIYNGKRESNDKDFKHKIAGKYATRLFRHGQNKNFALSNMPFEDKMEWLNSYSKCLNKYMPREADQYVTSIFRIKLEAIRQNDLLNVMIADELIKNNLK